MKAVPYDTPAAVSQASRELLGLRAALGKTHLVQGVAAIQHNTTADQHCLCILTEYGLVDFLNQS